MKIKAYALAISLLLASTGLAQTSPDVVEHKYFVGTTAFVLFNLLPDPEPPRYAQLNLGIQITPRDALSLELITWQYYGPLGRPYGTDKKSTGFPGRVRTRGVGLAYKRNVLGRWYVAVHSTPLLQEYLSGDGERIQTGFQLFNTARIGYDAELLRGRVYIQPSVAVTSWPINTNLPESFQVEEDKWRKFFLFEPGLHVGVRL